MKEELADTIFGFVVCIGVCVIALLTFGLGYVKGEDDLIQKLCTQQQYDFCEAIEPKPEYKLKELKQDE